jgi:hypothetical protein
MIALMATGSARGEALVEARAALRRADWQAARDLYQQALQDEPDQPDARYAGAQSSG